MTPDPHDNKSPPGAVSDDDSHVLAEILDMVLLANQVGTWQWDLSNRTVTWDDNMFQLFGEVPDPRRASDIWRKRVDHADRVRIKVQTASLADGSLAEVLNRYTLTHVDGTRRVITGRSRLLRNGDGTASFVFGVNWDITKQLAVRSELADQRQRLDIALDAAEMGSFRWDLKTRNVDYDARLFRLYGVPEGADTKAVFKAAVDPADRERTAESIRAALRDGELRTRFRIHRPDGTTTWLEARGRVFYDDDGVPESLVGVNFDVRASVDTERALVRASERSLAASAAKSAFLATMSHEIRTPLNGVVGLADALARADLTPGQRPLIAAMQSSANALRALIDDILDLSKIEAGAITLSAARFSLDDLLTDLRSLLGTSCADKGLELRVRAAAGTGDVWLGDATRIRQVLVNVVGNAVKFTDSGHVDVVVRAGPPGLRFEVVDTGIGIPLDVLPTLFERFVQADSTPTRRHGGTGLGLAISRALVERMGGQITASSPASGGAVVVFTLGVTSADPAVASSLPPLTTEEVRVAASRLRVLVVEDNAINHMVVDQQLRAIGVGETAWACDGAEAVRLANARRWDLILMDLQMPTMDGYEATLRIRADGRSTGAAIVALTAHAMSEDRARCMACGMNEYVSKPASLTDLTAVVTRAAAATHRAASA